MNEVAVVICNYNKRDYVINCIESIFKSSFNSFDLIVVDNASNDGSAEAIRKRFGDRLTLIENKINTGGAGGFRLGMQFAMDKNYRYIMLSDNDIVVDKNAVGELYNFMEEHPKAGACGSTIYFMNDPECILEMGAKVDYYELGIHGFFNNERNIQLPYALECEYVAACSAMYRCDVLRESGLMDEEFFIYFDDIDLSIRIRKAGYKIYAISASKVWHSMIPPSNPTTIGHYYFFRNKLYVFAKWIDDEDFSRLAQMLTVRLARISFLERDRREIIDTYNRALNDLFAHKRGKAEEGIIVGFDPATDKFKKMFEGKKKIAINCHRKCGLDYVIRQIKRFCDAEITIVTHNLKVEIIPGINYVIGLKSRVGFDLVVNLCYHVLDIPDYDRDAVYIDRYFNYLLDDEDYDYVGNFDEYGSKYFDLNYPRIKTGLDELRKSLRGKNV